MTSLPASTQMTCPGSVRVDSTGPAPAALPARRCPSSAASATSVKESGTWSGGAWGTVGATARTKGGPFSTDIGTLHFFDVSVLPGAPFTLASTRNKRRGLELFYNWGAACGKITIK